MSIEGSVSLNVANGVATVKFFHPQSNSLPGILLEDLARHIEEAGERKDVQVIVLCSEGDKTFCAGASFDELASITSIEQGRKFFSGFAKVINAMRKAPVFIIARVQGKAVGGGVGLACAADYTLATTQSSIKLSELAVGIGPFVVGPAVERKAGKSAFTHLTINAAQWQTSEWALSKGIYNSIYISIEELDKAVGALAQTLSASNPEAMQMLKKIMWEDAADWDQLLPERAEMSGRLVLSDFTKNAIAKFKQGSR
jgi:methylglutaconyl-CoA hydratase